MRNVQDDILIIKKITNGDKKAFNTLFDAYFIPLCRYMYMYTENKQIIEELVLDIFTYIWEHRTKLHIRISIKAYLFQSARNRYLNYLRDQRETVSLEDIRFDINENNINNLEYDELEQIVKDAVMSLPERCKEIYHLSRDENQTNQEIATRFDLSIKTVEGHITKALKHIKKYLGDKYSYLW